MDKTISIEALRRLPIYLNYLKSLPVDGPVNISSTIIVAELGLNDVQVRKDLSVVSRGGRPKIGHVISDLIDDIEEFLGCKNSNDAAIVGVGNLGHALLSYDGFTDYGLDIVVAFDSDEARIGGHVNGREIISATKLKDLCSRMKIKIGIIAVPAYEAQSVCDALIESGVLAIWNFAPTRLKVPENILIQNENMACSLAVLSKHLTEKLSENT